MCGFYAATSAGSPISSSDFQKQVFDVLDRYDPRAFLILGIFNAGNLLNEAEMPFNALEKICMRIAQNPYIQRLTIEAKLEYLDFEKLKKISAILEGKEIELGIGVETLNEKVKDLCINKPFSNTRLQQRVNKLMGLGIIPKAYLLLKPPFLTEKEAIDDFISSYIQLNQMGVRRIDCETMTVEEHTLVHRLWQKNHYRTPWLWTLVHLLEQLGNSQLYLTPFRYIVKSIAVAHNCERCSERIKNKIFDCQEGKTTLKDLVKEHCSCKDQWREELQKKDDRALEQRIIDVLSTMNSVHPVA